MSIASAIGDVVRAAFGVKVAGQTASAASNANQTAQLILVSALVGVAAVFVLAFMWNSRKERKRKRSEQVHDS